MRTVKDLEQLHATVDASYGYVDITMFNCPPFVMFTNNDCGICWMQRTKTPFEPASTALWCALVPHATYVFDIGARCGEFSLMAAALNKDLRIHTFEPNPDNFARLLVNMLANDVTTIRPHRVALADSEQLAPFTWVTKKLGHLSSGGSLLRGAGVDATTTVAQTTRLDTFMQNFTVGDRPLMKIDVEGAEVHVFKGMPNLLQKRPDIIVECLDDNNCPMLMELTQGLGYRYYAVLEKELKLVQRERLQVGHFGPDDYNHFLSTRDFGAEVSLADYDALRKRLAPHYPPLPA